MGARRRDALKGKRVKPAVPTGVPTPRGRVPVAPSAEEIDFRD